MNKSNLWSLELREAIGYIRGLHEDKMDPKSLADLEDMLIHGADVAIGKTSIGKWLKYHLNDAIPPKTIAKIIKVAAFLKEHTEFPDTICFGVISNATEMLPVHLLEKYPQWQKKHGAVVKLDNGSKQIEDIMEKLQHGNIDFAIAPHDSKIANNHTSVKRFFDIAKIKVGGIFPFDSYKDGQQFAHGVKTLTDKGQVVGALPNADYAQSLGTFLKEFSVNPPATISVRNHDEALKRLKDGEIHGVIGHNVFITNVYQGIKHLRKHPQHQEELDILERLNRIPFGVFADVVMSIFVNIDKVETVKVARKALGLLVEAVDHMSHDIGDMVLEHTVNEVLGLNAKDKMSGNDVLKECKYKVEAFEKDVLLLLWKSTSSSA